MTKSPLITSALLGVSVFGLSAAYAQEGPAQRDGRRGPPPHERLAAVDTNGDGNISIAEIEARETEQFANVDANNDGQVTAEEMFAFGEARREEARRQRENQRASRMVAQLDTNGDGMLSVEEFTSRPRQMFARMDADGDGQITAEERQALRGQRGEHRGERRRDHRDHEGRRHEGRFQPPAPPAED